MNGYLLDEYVMQYEAPLRERAAAEAAQRELARQRHPQAVGHALRSTLGQALVRIGRFIQVQPAQALNDCGDAAA